MGVCSTVGIKSSATLVANLTLKGTCAFPGEQNVVSYEVLDIEDGLQSLDSWPMGVCSTVGIKSSATLVANLTLKGTCAFPGEQRMRICDMEYEKVVRNIKEFLDLIFHGFRGDFRDGRSDHLTQKRQLLPDLNGTKCVQQNAVGRVHHPININILCSPGNAHVPFSVKLATKVALDFMPTVEQTPIGQLSKLCSPSSISNTS
ncbi:hypothetical protein T07_7021 [Trichinella nelsoni]|uniref:Uncharacterized protein n=1 Tax=Trichinella nelsoni TaxID=6336 RepID=A0A0V0RQ09_9BILA|nr:hypothetical protein T07_7021 [Trichinella nelsoni]